MIQVSLNEQLLVDFLEEILEIGVGDFVIWLALLITWLLATLNSFFAPYCHQGDCAHPKVIRYLKGRVKNC